MKMRNTLTRLASAAALAIAVAGLAPAAAQTVRTGPLPAGTQRPSAEVLLSVGQGQLVTLPTNVADVWTSNDKVADIYVGNPRQIHLFGKEEGEATVFATTRSGQLVYATNVRVSQNITSVDRVLKLAMPDADIRAVNAGQVTVLTGTVATPDDAVQAEQLVRAYLNPGVDVTAPNATLKMGVVSRLKVATPLQVNLQVRIAEVSRELSKEIGVNLATLDPTGGFGFGIFQGRTGGVTINPSTGVTTVTPSGNGSTLAFLGRLFGVDVSAALDLAENDGFAATLANPNLTALSGETASFLAGGEIPIPQSTGLGAVSVQFKQYGVSLAFTPTVLADGRISLRVRPEVSQLSSAGAVKINGFEIPALTTRRAETTIELGSGQAMMIGGLLSNSNTNAIEKAPFLGDLPIIGALFRSQRFRRQETELMIIVTPYLVKPVSANRIALPTDGYRTPDDAQRVLLGQTFTGKSGEQRPVPTSTAPQTVIGSGRSQTRTGAIAPGFSQ